MSYSNNPTYNPDRISMLLPTRGRPEKLEKALTSYQDTVHSKTLFDVWLYIDNDDAVTINFLNSDKLKKYSFTIHWVIGERPVSQGEMVNKLVHACTSNPGIYIPTGDDYIYSEPDWDIKIRDAFNAVPDRIALIHIPDPYSVYDEVTLPIVSAEWLNITGHLFTEYFPFWYDDIWLGEVAQLIGRVIKVPIKVALVGGRGKTPRMKNLLFWNHFYINTLSERMAEAELFRKKIFANSHEGYLSNCRQAEETVKSIKQGRQYQHTSAELIQLEALMSEPSKLYNPSSVYCYMLLETAAVVKLLHLLDPLVKQNKFEEAISLLDNISYASQSMKDINYLRASYLKELHRLEEAEETALQGLQSAPEDIKTIDLLKQIRAARGKC